MSDDAHNPNVSPSRPPNARPTSLVAGTNAAQASADTAAKPRPTMLRSSPIAGVSNATPRAAMPTHRKWINRRDVATASPSGPRKAIAEAIPSGMPYCSDSRNGNVMPASVRPKSRMRSQYFRSRPSIFGREISVNTIAANVVLNHAVPELADVGKQEGRQSPAELDGNDRQQHERRRRQAAIGLRHAARDQDPWLLRQLRWMHRNLHKHTGNPAVVGVASATQHQGARHVNRCVQVGARNRRTTLRRMRPPA